MCEVRFEKLRARLADLNTRNARLEDENRVLKCQYEEALEVANAVRDTHDENLRLQATVNRITAERDELQQRLDIALRRFEGERQESPAPPLLHERLFELKADLQREKENLQAEARGIRDSLEHERQERERAQVDRAEAEAALKRLLDTAQIRFGTVFTTAEQLRLFLTSPDTVKVTEGETNEQQLDVVRREGERAVEKLQRRLKAEKKGRKREVAEIVDGHNRQKAKLEQAVTDLEAQVEEAHRAVRESDFHHRQELVASDGRIRELEGAVEALRNQNAHLQSVNEKLGEVSRRVPMQMENTRTDTRVIASMKKQSEKELKIREKENHRLLAQLKKLEARVVETAEELQKTVGEKEKLEIELDELNESLENALAQQKAEKVACQQKETALSDIEARASSMKQVNELLKQNIERQKEELGTMYGERERLIGLVQNAMNVIISMEAVVEKLTSENKRLKAHVEELKAIPAPEPVRETVVEQIPYTSWFAPEFPGDLRSVVADICQNNVTPTALKLKHVLSAVGKFYNDVVSEKDKQISEKQEYLDTFCDRLDSFLVSLGTVIGKGELKATQILSDKSASSVILDTISQMKTETQEVAKAARSTTEQLSQIFKAIGVTNFNDCLTEIRARTEGVKRIEKLAKTQKQKARKLKKKEKQLRSQLQERELALKAVIDGQKSTISELEKANRAAESTILEHQMEITDLQGRAQTMSLNLQKEPVQTHQEDFEPERRQLLQSIEELRQKLQDSTKKNEKQEREVCEWKSVAASLKQEKKRRDAQLQDLEAQTEKMRETYQARMATEKQALKSQYEQLIEKLRQKNSELRALSAQSGEAAEACESKNRELVKRLNSCDKENERIRQRAVLQDEEIGRERQLLSTKSRALAIQAEMKCQSLVEEMKLKHEEEKTQICSYVISQFKELFDGRQCLNVPCMKQIVEKASSEYHRLLMSDQSIRRLLCISVPESTEDAVARLVLSAHSGKGVQ